MRTLTQKAGTACGAAFAVVALGFGTATTAGAVSTDVVIGGIGTPTLGPLVMNQLLGGALSDEDQRVSVDWPAEAGPFTGPDDMTLGASIAIGKENLKTQINAALAQLDRDANGNVINGERVTVVGLSAGSLVVTEVLRDMATDPNAPSKGDINFVVVADSSRQQFINKPVYNADYDYTYQPAADTKYDTVVVTGEYDGYADFPDRPFNLLALQNAQAGKIFVHIPSMFSDLTKVPQKNVASETNSLGGTVTSYLVPTAKLPLVQANPSLAPREAQLKAQIDKAYSRNDAVPPPGAPATAIPASVLDTIAPHAGTTQTARLAGTTAPAADAGSTVVDTPASEATPTPQADRAAQRQADRQQRQADRQQRRADRQQQRSAAASQA